MYDYDDGEYDDEDDGNYLLLIQYLLNKEYRHILRVNLLLFSLKY